MARHQQSNAPAISYTDALRLYISESTTIASANAFTFQHWITAQLATLDKDKQSAVRVALREYDFSFLPDRWACVLLLLEYGVSLPQKTEADNVDRKE